MISIFDFAATQVQGGLPGQILEGKSGLDPLVGNPYPAHSAVDWGKV